MLTVKVVVLGKIKNFIKKFKIMDISHLYANDKTFSKRSVLRILQFEAFVKHQVSLMHSKILQTHNTETVQQTKNNISLSFFKYCQFNV